MRFLSVRRALLTLSIAFTVAQADAALISVGDPVFGPDSVTYDTETGLYWLDVTATTGISLNAVAAAINEGGSLHGWAFATEDQVSALWTSVGVPLPLATFAFGSAQNDGALLLNALLGSQRNTAQQVTSAGFIYELSTVSPRWWEVAAALSPAGTGFSSASFLIASFDTPSPVIGTYLVRAARPIPEPSVLALLSIGLVALAFARRRETKPSTATSR